LAKNVFLGMRHLHGDRQILSLLGHDRPAAMGFSGAILSTSQRPFCSKILLSNEKTACKSGFL
jgi:hypothetical protein